MKAIEVMRKESYGTVRYYPTQEIGKSFARHMGQKTLTIQDIDMLKQLGHTVVMDDSNRESFLQAFG